MSHFTILGTVEFVPGTRDQLLAALTAHRARSLREPGTLQFEVLIPHDKQATVYTYEEYTDEQAFATHVNGPSFARVNEETAEVVTSLIASRLTTFDIGTLTGEATSQ